MPSIAKTGVEDLLHGRFRRPCARFMPPPAALSHPSKKRLQAPFKALVKRARKILGGKQTVRGDHIFGRYFLRKRSAHRAKNGSMPIRKDDAASRKKSQAAKDREDLTRKKLQLIAEF